MKKDTIKKLKTLKFVLEGIKEVLGWVIWTLDKVIEYGEKNARTKI